MLIKVLDKTPEKYRDLLDFLYGPENSMVGNTFMAAVIEVKLHLDPKLKAPLTGSLDILIGVDESLPNSRKILDRILETLDVF